MLKGIEIESEDRKRKMWDWSKRNQGQHEEKASWGTSTWCWEIQVYARNEKWKRNPFVCKLLQTLKRRSRRERSDSPKVHAHHRCLSPCLSIPAACNLRPLLAQLHPQHLCIPCCCRGEKALCHGVCVSTKHETKTSGENVRLWDHGGAPTGGAGHRGVFSQEKWLGAEWQPYELSLGSSNISFLVWEANQDFTLSLKNLPCLKCCWCLLAFPNTPA